MIKLQTSLFRNKCPLLFLIVINDYIEWLLLNMFYDIDHTNCTWILNDMHIFPGKNWQKEKKRDNSNDHEELKRSSSNPSQTNGS